MYDFIAIGDTVTDAFIRLKDAEVNCDIDDDNCKISMSFGDKLPYEFVEECRAVGNSPNAATSASRLGLKTALVTNVGKDTNGDECIKTIKEENISTEFVAQEDGKKTNYHYVLWYESDRTILINHEHFTYSLPDIGAPKWVYLSSLGEGTEDYHNAILEHLKSNPNIFLAFQPGTFQMAMGKDKLSEIYKRAKITFCNVQEAEKILEIDTLGIKELLKRFKALGPEIVIITDGPKGAYAYDGENIYFQPPYPDPKPPYERTGAGDAFSSTVAVSLALGNDLSTSLQWGSINSMAVVQEIGAQKGLLSRKKIEEYLKQAPKSFKTQIM